VNEGRSPHWAGRSLHYLLLVLGLLTFFAAVGAGVLHSNNVQPSGPPAPPRGTALATRLMMEHMERETEKAGKSPGAPDDQRPAPSKNGASQQRTAKAQESSR
jgi:hypothetical protein